MRMEQGTSLHQGADSLRQPPLGIADRSLDESAALLREIFGFAETDRFVMEVRRSVGDIII